MKKLTVTMMSLQPLHVAVPAVALVLSYSSCVITAALKLSYLHTGLIEAWLAMM